MKLLFDQNLSFKLCARLNDVFPDSQQVRLLDMSSSSDAEIWGYARTNKFLIVTQDSDFADMAGLLGPPPQVVWLRCGNQSTPKIEQFLRLQIETIQLFGDDESAACLEIY